MIFNFSDTSTSIGAALDGETTGTFNVDGIEITATALIDEFNVTGSGFGINQAASNDDTDAFDFTQDAPGPGVAEGFTLSFDQAVTLINFEVSSWNSGVDEVTLMDGATIIATISSTGINLLGNYSLGAFSPITVNTTAGSYGNGWSFDAITVAAVPEPSLYGLIASACGIVLVTLRRR
ncbi:MAG: hypothetical protein ACPGSB_07210 [Opitutales bacterium]